MIVQMNKNSSGQGVNPTGGDSRGAERLFGEFQGRPYSWMREETKRIARIFLIRRCCFVWCSEIRLNFRAFLWKNKVPILYIFWVFKRAFDCVLLCRQSIVLSFSE